MNNINETKHYLKLILNETPGDKLKEFITKELEYDGKCVFYQPIKHVMKFLQWKIIHPNSVIDDDKTNIERGGCKRICQIK